MELPVSWIIFLLVSLWRLWHVLLFWRLSDVNSVVAAGHKKQAFILKSGDFLMKFLIFNPSYFDRLNKCYTFGFVFYFIDFIHRETDVLYCLWSLFTCFYYGAFHHFILHLHVLLFLQSLSDFMCCLFVAISENSHAFIVKFRKVLCFVFEMWLLFWKLLIPFTPSYLSSLPFTHLKCLWQTHSFIRG